MAKYLTRAKCRKRLLEAKMKFQKVYMKSNMGYVTTKDMEAVEKIVARCLKRIQ